MSYNDGTISATYMYDDAGRKLTETVNYGSFSKSFSYTYYGNGLKQTFTAPDGTVYTYLYGLNNELQDVQIPGVGSISIPAYTWNRPATVNYPGGTQRTYGYDALMRIQSLSVTDPTSTPLLDYTYTYDEVGNILTKTTEHGNYTYGYDAMSRVLTADNPVLADESYTGACPELVEGIMWGTGSPQRMSAAVGITTSTTNCWAMKMWNMIMMRMGI